MGEGVSAILARARWRLRARARARTRSRPPATPAPGAKAAATLAQKIFVFSSFVLLRFAFWAGIVHAEPLSRLILRAEDV